MEVSIRCTKTLSPMVLLVCSRCFATLIKSDLKFPEGLYIGLIYLHCLRWDLRGVKLSATPMAEFYKPALGAILMCSPNTDLVPI